MRTPDRIQNRDPLFLHLSEEEDVTVAKLERALAVDETNPQARRSDSEATDVQITDGELGERVNRFRGLYRRVARERMLRQFAEFAELFVLRLQVMHHAMLVARLNNERREA